MDRFRGLMQPAAAPASSERRTPPDRVKSACPYCFLEIYVCELRQHLSACPLFHASQIDSEPRPNLLPPSPSDWHPRFPDSPHFISASESEEEANAEPLTIMSRFLSPDQTFRSDFDDISPECDEKQSENVPESALCPVCFSEYSQPYRLPIVLPVCGHTICQQCVRRIYRENAMVKCPVCRAEHYETISSFPVNLAVLEIAEGRKKGRGCEEHGAEVIAFCEEHRKLLCGMCVFEHKEHKSFLLTSPEARSYTLRLKSSLSDIESRLSSYQASWQSFSEQLDSLSRSLSASLQYHSSQLHTAELRIVHSIRSGKSACVDQLKSLMLQRGPGAIQGSCSCEILRINRDLQRLHENKSHFDSLSITEQLKTTLSYRPENYPKPPSLASIHELNEKLSGEIDYEKAIEERSLVESGGGRREGRD